MTLASTTFSPTTARTQSTTTPLTTTASITTTQSSGRKWSIVTPASTSAKLTDLDGVSCVSRSFCAAVGSSAPSASAEEVDTLFESWNGAGWSTMSSSGSARKGELIGVSCVTAKFCVGVGAAISSSSSSSAPLIVSWNGKSWSTMAAPSGTGAFLATSVSCVSVQFCVAVGAAVTGTSPKTLGEKPLILLWDGKHWSEMSAVHAGTNLSILTSVSCTSPKACLAVGADGTLGSKSAKIVGLTESFDGSAWTVVPDPPAAQNLSELDGVSCSSSDLCLAVGVGRASTLTESWNGKRWATMGGQALVGDELSGVTCATSSSSWQCTTVGARGSVAIEQAAPPGDSASAALLHVPYCAPPSATECGYSGSSTAAPDTTVVADSVNGGPWTIEPSESVMGSDTVLDGVACVAASAGQQCAAVGLHAKPSTSSSISVSALIEMNF